jgi:hypothetical protein
MKHFQVEFVADGKTYSIKVTAGGKDKAITTAKKALKAKHKNLNLDNAKCSVKYINEDEDLI